jgi:hypothetical protein
MNDGDKSVGFQLSHNKETTIIIAYSYVKCKLITIKIKKLT